MSWGLILVLLAFAAVLILVADRARAGLGVPEGRLVYADMGDELRLAKPLYDADLDLVGRPDYLIRSGNRMIPVEVKSGRTPSKPYDSHIFQLAAYCVLVARHFGVRPQYGLIRYPENHFRVDFTAALEAELLSLLDDMRTNREKDDLPRSHNQAARCRACGHLQVCDQSL